MPNDKKKYKYSDKQRAAQKKKMTDYSKAKKKQEATSRRKKVGRYAGGANTGGSMGKKSTGPSKKMKKGYRTL